MTYGIDIEWTWCMQYMELASELCIHFRLCGIYDLRQGLSDELRLEHKQHDRHLPIKAGW